MNLLEKTIHDVITSNLFYKDNFNTIMQMIHKPFTHIQIKGKD